MIIDSKNSQIKKALTVAVILVSSVLAGTMLMMLVNLLPVDTMRYHALEKISIQVKETDYHRFISNDSTSQNDGFTDALMINSATYNGDRSLLDKALLVPRMGYSNHQVESLDKSLHNVSGGHEATYARYWHGYLVFLKPLLMVFNISQIRWINTLLGISLVTIIILGLHRRFHTYKYSLAFIGAILFLNPVVMRMSLQYNTVFYVILLEYIVALYYGDKIAEKGEFYLIFLMSGISVAFFDLLTYPIAALGMLLVLQLLMFNSTISENILRAVTSSAVWLWGYLGMWAGKWIMASLLTDQNVIANAIGQILYRTGTQTSGGEAGVVFSWLKLFKSNFSWLTGQNAILFKLFMIAVVVGIIILLAQKVIEIKIKPAILITGIVLCFIPIVRYVVVSNHSFIHDWFTYRECVVIIMSVLCSTFSSLQFRDDSRV